MKKQESVISSNEAKEILIKEVKDRQERCMKRIKEVLDEENCDLNWFEHKVNGQTVQAGFQTSTRQ